MRDQLEFKASPESSNGVQKALTQKGSTRPPKYFNFHSVFTKSEKVESYKLARFPSSKMYKNQWFGTGLPAPGGIPHR